jgi:23S rRNA (guanosine2251-2'-O)-methyltransferase
MTDLEEYSASMNVQAFEARICLNPDCGLRYTLEIGNSRGKRCPNCHSDTISAGLPFSQMDIPENPAWPAVPPIEILLDNIRSAWNVGSILRAADGAGVRRVHLCGVSPRPDQPKVAKTALGAEQSLPWESHPDGAKFCQQCKEDGYHLWALEGGKRAEPIYQVNAALDAPLLFVVGNEVTGVDPGILALCERIVYLPMMGAKGSLNVAVAFGIGIYTLRFGNARRTGL